MRPRFHWGLHCSLAFADDSGSAASQVILHLHRVSKLWVTFWWEFLYSSMGSFLFLSKSSFQNIILIPLRSSDTKDFLAWLSISLYCQFWPLSHALLELMHVSLLNQASRSWNAQHNTSLKLFQMDRFWFSAFWEYFLLPHSTSQVSQWRNISTH